MRARVTRDGVVCVKNSPFGINGKGIQLGSPTPVMAPDMIDSPYFTEPLYIFCLAGGDEWKLVAERLGLDQEKIRFLDNRTLNPADILIGYIANQRHLTVADLYEVLCDCELPVIADTL